MRQDVLRVAARLAASYPETRLGNPHDPLDDLFLIILSGQTNEVLYTKTFEKLKKAFPSWRGLAKGRLDRIAGLIKDGGLSRQKAQYLKSIARQLERDWGRPNLRALHRMKDHEIEEYLLSLPGVGIKTARCVMMYTLHREVFPADVNCLRIMERLGWIDWAGRRAESLARVCQEVIPSAWRQSVHIDLVQHGREVCKPRKPQCHRCCVEQICAARRASRPALPSLVDLCCGAGGFSWGFLQAGFDVRIGADVCAYSLQTFAVNLPGAKPMELDVCGPKAADDLSAALNDRSPNVVIAGPPCQGFSRAGRRDPDDPRNRVLRDAAKLAVSVNPELIVLENVMNAGTQAFVHHLNRAMAVFRRGGYRYHWRALDARCFGVPQSRKRIVVLAARDIPKDHLVSALDDLANRELVKNVSVSAALAGIPAKISRNGHVHNHVSMLHSEKVRAKIARIEPGDGPLSYRKLHPDRAAPTLICGNRAMPCHYADPRTITVREAARIQGFPDEFVFQGTRSSQMSQVANAVPPKMALGVADAVRCLLGLPKSAPKSFPNNVLRRLSFRPRAGPA